MRVLILGLMTICFNITVVPFAKAQYLDTLSISEGFKHADVIDFGGLYATTNHINDIKSILALEDDPFVPVREMGLSFSPTDEVYWMKMNIKNRTAQLKPLVVNMEYPLMNLLQFYVVREDTIEYSKLMGDSFPFYQREIWHRDFLYQTDIMPHECITIYIYFNKANENTSMFTSVWDDKTFYNHDRKATLGWSIYIGASLCIVLLIFFVGIFIRQSLLLLFTIYVISILLAVVTNLGMGYQYIWSDFPEFNQIANYFFLLFFMMTLIELTRRFLNIPELFPSINKGFNILQVISVFWFAYLVCFTYGATTGLSDTIAFYIGHPYLILVPISVIGTAILTYRKTKNRSHLIYITGFLFFIFSYILHLLSTLELITDNLLTRYSIPFGTTIDILILLLIFSNRIRQTFLKNIQLQHELTKTQLQAANALLEGQVQERKRLSQELHDGISIKMALLKMQLHRIFQQKNNETKAVINEIDNISEDIRNFTHAISPLNLEEETLEDAIGDLIYKIEGQVNMEIELSLNSFEEQRLNDNQKHTLYQILNELFNNTIKYAEATLIKIQLATIEHFVVFSYQDNGKGFDVNTIKSGIGLKNIQARVNLLNGTYNVNSDKEGSRFEFTSKI